MTSIDAKIQDWKRRAKVNLPAGFEELARFFLEREALLEARIQELESRNDPGGPNVMCADKTASFRCADPKCKTPVDRMRCGGRGMCLTCYHRAWVAENRDRVSLSDGRWRLANSEKIRERRQAWYTANRERLCEVERERYLANSEKIRERRRTRYTTNRDRLCEAEREQYRASRPSREESPE